MWLLSPFIVNCVAASVTAPSLTDMLVAPASHPTQTTIRIARGHPREPSPKWSWRRRCLARPRLDGGERGKGLPRSKRRKRQARNRGRLSYFFSFAGNSPPRAAPPVFIFELPNALARKKEAHTRMKRGCRRATDPGPASVRRPKNAEGGKFISPSK